MSSNSSRNFWYAVNTCMGGEKDGEDDVSKWTRRAPTRQDRIKCSGTLTQPTVHGPRSIYTDLGVLRVSHDVHVPDARPVLVQQALLLVLERKGRELGAGAAVEAGLAVGERAALEHVRPQRLGEAEGRDAEVALCGV